MFERRLYYHIDWALVAAILALCTIGVVMIYSTTSDPTRGASKLFITQLYAIVIGLGAMLFMLSIDYRAFADKSHIIYVGLLALLVYVMFFGMVQMGARRWIALRVFNLQPSEFAKIVVALV
ncbi:MAG TPA: FtsW/RodA/SpoVE family cell cycle protein, partial [Vicinamibacterales bacterium]|nr:FtsW/RodA/SpoVE family cell cycle protein [Vicinamibacterales bacterium]